MIQQRSTLKTAVIENAVAESCESDTHTVPVPAVLGATPIQSQSQLLKKIGPWSLELTDLGPGGVGFKALRT